MVLEIFTLAHVVISLIGTLAGFVVVWGLINSKHLDGWTSLFLWTTVLTSVTGFMFPYHGFQPSYVVGIVSLLVLTVAISARYRRHMAGAWRPSYVITSVIALYLNFFVLVVQLFRRVPALKVLAPTQSEPPFKVAQLIVLLFFIAIGILATVKFRHEELRTA